MRFRRAATSAIALASLPALSLGASRAAGAPALVAPYSAAAVRAAMTTPTTLTYWSWATISPGAVKSFEARYPAIKVNLVNVGSGATEYEKLRTALKAGKGAPDAAFMEYSEIPSFRLTGSLANLAPYGARGLQADFIGSSWSGVADSQGVWALPNGGDPLIALYRKDLLAKAGITSLPQTWDAFASDAAAVKAKTGAAMANLPPGDGASFLGFLQQAGANPFSYNGRSTVTIDLTSPAAEKVASFWQALVAKGEVSTDADFTSDWYQSIAKGKYASIQIGPWGPGVLSSTSGSSDGKWVAAPLPSWTPGSQAAGSWVSGSSDVVLASSQHKIAAYEFVKFIDTNVGVSLAGTKLGQFPPLKAVLSSPSYIDATEPLTGHQKVNQVSIQVAKHIMTPQGFVPFWDYVSSTYTSVVGVALANKTSLQAALGKWQQELVTYAKQQGFTVK